MSDFAWFVFVWFIMAKLAWNLFWFDFFAGAINFVLIGDGLNLLYYLWVYFCFLLNKLEFYIILYCLALCWYFYLLNLYFQTQISKVSFEISSQIEFLTFKKLLVFYSFIFLLLLLIIIRLMTLRFLKKSNMQMQKFNKKIRIQGCS